MSAPPEVTLDPHWDRLNVPELEKYRQQNEANYRAVLVDGIVFRGWRFWPPFFCCGCGKPTTASQWLFARGCDTRDHGSLFHFLAGAFAEEPGDHRSKIKRPINIHSHEGKRTIEDARLQMIRFRKLKVLG